MSYTLYTFAGGMITFAVAIVVSILTGGTHGNRIKSFVLANTLMAMMTVMLKGCNYESTGCSSSYRVDDRYLHPLLHRKSKAPKMKASVIRHGTSDNNLDRIRSSLNITKPSTYPNGYIMVAPAEKTVGGGATSSSQSVDSAAPDTPGNYTHPYEQPLLYRLPSYQSNSGVFST